MDYDKIMSNPQATRYVFQHVGIEEENDDDEPTGLAAMDLGVEDDGYQPMTMNDAVERETQPKSTNMPTNWPRYRYHQMQLRQGGVQREREMRERSGRWKVEGALYKNHYMLISYVWDRMGLDLWVYGVQEWADSTLYNWHLYTLGEIPLGVWLRVLASDG
ncbi:hypothetical protein N7491_010879 [Penicillium cf. griseofulvum]|uniref:Uncharacterized protein n=1 Tax=Penicillium cf. griseofulvum TaxID=2972120 RepID=A0A9W9N0L9_9EURO|nr:hypothetical protein N7472_001202 [Penicillium cf. griseofulvum]KAJ5422434.1 hypothetical protein N7491_010879 [Penicillium cf. griseofulvum]KAJ5428617.1 hypothetical protein N7445_010071 [Penicillium cf. griseofulvum]